MSDVQSSLEATGSTPLGTDCLSFLQIPHSPRLFTDFLYDFGKVSNFYPLAPHSPEQLTVPQVPADLTTQLAVVIDRQTPNFAPAPPALKPTQPLATAPPPAPTPH